MTTTYRSTAIAAADRCPAAVDYVRTGAKAPRHVVATGVAAHAYLQARTERPEGDALTTATATARSLIAEGRQFDGVAEGGYPPTAVWAGINLAHEWEDAAPAYLKGSKAEVRILGRPDWRLTDNPSEARWSATIDNMATADDWLTAYEYKTSWPAGREWLSGPQAKVQTCLLWALVESDPRLRGLILTMVNLRTGQAHEREYARADAPEVKRMRDELTITAEALDRLMSPNRGPGHGPEGRPKQPGPGCDGCLWWEQCAPAAPGGMEPSAWAATWAAARATERQARRRVTGIVADAPVDLPGGWVVGYEDEGKLRVRPDAATIVAALIPGLDPEDRAAWQSALSIGGVTVAALRRFAEKWPAVDFIGRAAEVGKTLRLNAWKKGE